MRGGMGILGLQGLGEGGFRGRTGVSDAGIHGIAEAYGSPGIGVKEAIHGLRGLFVGKDPLQIDRLYTRSRYTDGSAHAQQRAMSGRSAASGAGGL